MQTGPTFGLRDPIFVTDSHFTFYHGTKQLPSVDNLNLGKACQYVSYLYLLF